MASELEKKIDGLLLAGEGKKNIWQKLKKNEPHKILFYINNISHPADRKKFLLVNLILVLALTFITVKKLLTAFSFGAVDISLFLSLVVPTINIYVLQEILRFHRMGYRFLFVLSCLSLVQPENHHAQELGILLLMIVLSGFLYKKMFPEKDVIKVS